jgi:hypothetical protein
MWLILVFVPNLLDFATLSVFLAFAPDLGLILLISGVASGLAALTRIVVYIAFTRGRSVVPVEQH